MNTLSLDLEWLTNGNDSPEIQQTMGWFKLAIDDTVLTQNEDLWSKTIRDRVLVSTYPLAAWMASSWWRLLYEPLPKSKPSADWRMAHELTAANQGFIWPRIICASDTEAIQIWSQASAQTEHQSVRYLNGLEQPSLIRFHEFERTLKDFIESVVYRLDAVGIKETDLAGLWQEVKEEIADQEMGDYRRCEAEMGFDPDECSELLVTDALQLASRIGHQVFSEVAPVYGQQISEAKPMSETINELTEASGVEGKPQVPIQDTVGRSAVMKPWQRAKQAASNLRDALSIKDTPITNEQLYDLLGVQKRHYEAFVPDHRQPIALAIPSAQAGLKFRPRKKHPTAKRFELARFIGDYYLYGDQGQAWLTSTDLKTSRQKYQRAFAAELLCPLSSLTVYLESDYSESAIEDASEHFQVSSQTVESMLTNNGLMPAPWSVRDWEVGLPY